jgi:predicted DNA-binding protein (MmcQ/YjbR family)
MSYIHVFFYRYANYNCVSHIARTNYGDECELPPTICTTSTFGELFFWWGTYRADMLHGIIHSYCIKKIILKTKINLKIDSNLESYLENHSRFKPSWSFHLASKFWVSTLFTKLMEFPMTLISYVSPDFAAITLKTLKPPRTLWIPCESSSCFNRQKKKGIWSYDTLSLFYGANCDLDELILA